MPAHRIAIFIGCLVFFLIPALPAEARTGVLIQHGNPSTKTRNVTLKLTAPDSVKKMKIGFESDLDDARWETYKKYKNWKLRYEEGVQQVYVRYLLEGNEKTSIYSDKIQLRPPPIKIEVEFTEDSPIATRYVTVSSTVSEGIDAFRIGVSSNLADKEFEPYRSQVPMVVSRGSGQKHVHIDFKDASGEVVRKQLAIQYNQPGRYISEGSLIKGTGPAIYYYGFDGLLHPFADAHSYQSWYTHFNDLNHISDAKLRQYRFGDPVCIRQGTFLLKFRGLPRVYAVERGCTLKPIRSEIEAYLLYGKNWHKKIIEYEQIQRRLYTVKDFDASNEDEDLEDEDKDGLNHEQEEEFGSSDRSADTDGDGLTDFEEIKYWFSDPNDADSDNDGFSDGSEILNGYSPVGPERLSRVPADTYTYPQGAVFIDEGNKGSIVHANGSTNLSKVGRSNSKSFTTNRFQERFIIRPPITFSFPKTSGSLKRENDDIRRPQVRTDSGGITSL